MSTVREDADVETSSDAYARRFAGPVGAFFLDVQGRLTLDLLHPWRGASVLDVGGGHGQLTGPLVDAGYDVTVLGSHPRCGARVLKWTATGQARFLSGELLATPFADASFDVVLAYRLLAHVRRWRELVAEMTRVARAAVIVDYPARRSANAVAGPLFPVKKGVEADTRPFAVFRDADVQLAFAERGFSATGRRPQFAWPMALHRAHGSARLARILEAGAGALGLRRLFGSPVILRLERRG